MANYIGLYCLCILTDSVSAYSSLLVACLCRPIYDYGQEKNTQKQHTKNPTQQHQQHHQN